MRLLAYINGIQRRERVFDAVMPIICAGRASDFDPAPAMPGPNGPNGGGKADRSARSMYRGFRRPMPPSNIYTAGSMAAGPRRGNSLW
jgi:hypothetical protein